MRGLMRLALGIATIGTAALTVTSVLDHRFLWAVFWYLHTRWAFRIDTQITEAR